jgi:hypothetical protein
MSESIIQHNISPKNFEQQSLIKSVKKRAMSNVRASDLSIFLNDQQYERLVRKQELQEEYANKLPKIIIDEPI